jgi:uncharacterized membrane protein YeiH
VSASTFVLVLDLLGTFVFALSGALVGVNKKLDLFGVLVLSFAAGNAGGITRDLLLGATPPPAISSWHYVVVSLGAGLLTFVWSPVVQRMQELISIIDAAGLALFAVSGATKAMDFHLNPLAAIMLGVLTGIGGGMLRDVLVSEVPTVLHADLYAVAALAGAAVVVGSYYLPLFTTTASLAGGVLCFAIRMIAIRRDWQLPKPHQPRDKNQPSPS